MYSAYKLNKQGDNIQPWRTALLNQMFYIYSVGIFSDKKEWSSGVCFNMDEENTMLNEISQIPKVTLYEGFLDGASGIEPTFQCWRQKRRRFNS